MAIFSTKFTLTTSLLLTSLLSASAEGTRAPITFDWATLGQTTPNDSFSSIVAIYNNELFVIGGYAKPIKVHIISIDDLNTTDSSLWTTLDWDMSYGGQTVRNMTHAPAGVQIDSKLYVAGDDNSPGTLLIYDLANKQPINSTTYDYSMPVDYITQSCTTSNGSHIFVMGGANYYNGSILDTFMIYDIDEDEWMIGNNLNTAVYQSVCEYSSYSNKLYLLGGFQSPDFSDASNIIQIFDLDNDDNEWVLSTETLQASRYSGGSIIYNSYIYSIAGESPEQTKDIGIFDTMDDSVLSNSVSEYPVLDKYVSIILDESSNIVYSIGGVMDPGTIRQAIISNVSNMDNSDSDDMKSSARGVLVLVSGHASYLLILVFGVVVWFVI